MSANEKETVTFQWSREHGDCRECGLPAAFYDTPYGTDEQRKLCAVCAANSAVDGETVKRLYRPGSVAVIDEELAAQASATSWPHVVARFDTVEEAEAFIAGIPDRDKVERGGYGIDA